MNRHTYYNIKRINNKTLFRIKIMPKGYGKMIALKKGGKKQVKGLILLNSDDGFIVQEVDAKMCDYDSKCFIRRDVSNPKHKLWYLVDIDTGVFVCYANTQKQLKEWYLDHKEQLDEIRKSPKYKIKVERFEKAKLVNNYSKGVK